MTPFSRRKFLATVGAAGALAPFLPILNADGQEPVYPKRLILFFTPHSSFLPKWTPTGTVNNWQLSPILAPLAPYKAKINVLNGVGMLPSTYFAGHTPGYTQLWTGSDLSRGSQNSDGSYNYGSALGPSVDQVIAKATAGITPYDSLQLSAWWCCNEAVNYAAAAQPVYPNNNPADALKRLFAQVNTQTLTDRNSILDAVTADLNALQNRLTTANQQKVQQHLTSIRDLERVVQSQKTACSGPNATSNGSMAQDWSAMLQITTAALACDLTRVISLQFEKGDNDGDSYPNLNVTAGHHPLTHMAPSDTVDANGNTVSDQTKSVNGQLTAIYTWYAQNFANLLQQLDAIPEGNGTLLDNSLVVWGSEISNYNTHDFGPTVPFVLAGGLGGTVKTGRYLDYSASPQFHNRLLVSILNLMGQTQVTKFGTMDKGQGPLSNL